MHDGYFLSKTIRTGEVEPLTDSNVMVLPSGESESVSVRTTFAPPATALWLVQIVTKFAPLHWETVSLGPCMGASFVTGFPVRSKCVLLSSSRPWNFVLVVTSRDVSACSIVCVISIFAIMPMFLLFSEFNCHVPEKSVCFAAKAAMGIRHRAEMRNLNFIVFSFAGPARRCGAAVNVANTLESQPCT